MYHCLPLLRGIPGGRGRDSKPISPPRSSTRICVSQTSKAITSCWKPALLALYLAWAGVALAQTPVTGTFHQHSVLQFGGICGVFGTSPQLSTESSAVFKVEPEAFKFDCGLGLVSLPEGEIELRFPP